MSTATSVPATVGLEGDDALATLRATGRRRLALDAFDRFRAADGFSHARALAFQFALTLVPALITVVGLATALEQGTFTRVVRDVLNDMTPGAAGDLVTAALRQGSAGARRENGEVALTLGGAATLIAGTTAFGLVFEIAPRRRQPEASWLAVGSGLAALLWLAFTGVLALLVGASENFGATYGPLAGTIAVLLWTLFSAVALLLGLAFAAQLEAVRAGVTTTRVEREEN